MAQQGFDMSKMSTANKIVGGGALAYLIWTFLPVWYKFSIDLGPLGSVVGSTSINGFRGVTLIAGLLALVALVGVVFTAMGTEMKMSVQPGLVQLGLAGLGLILTLLGLVSKPTGFGISWGYFVGLLLSLVWTYGAYMWYSEPGSSMPTGGGEGSGFTS